MIKMNESLRNMFYTVGQWMRSAFTVFSEADVVTSSWQAFTRYNR